MECNVTFAPVEHLKKLTVWAIGAYDGSEYSGWARKQLWEFHMFEPHPRSCNQLRRNFPEDDFPNVHIYEKAVTNDDEPEVDFYIPTKFRADQFWGNQVAGLTPRIATKVEIETQKTRVQAVNSQRLVDFTGSTPDVLIIDVEGFDFELMHLAITHLPYVVQYEHQHMSDEDKDECFQTLKELGYIPYHVTDLDLFWKKPNSAIPTS